MFGVKNFADIVHYYFPHTSDYSVAAFTVDGAYLKESTFRCLPVGPFEAVDQHFPPQGYDLFVAVGIAKVNAQRAVKVAEAEARGYRLASFISSRAARPPDLIVGPNTAIMDRAHSMPYVT